MQQLRQRHSSLPLSHAFVVQFRDDSRLKNGRVEHIASGRATHFHSLEALTGFLTQTLNEADFASEADGP